MIELVFGIGLCIGLCVLFVLFIRPKPEGCAGRSCSVCRDAAKCDVKEFRDE